MICDVLSSLDYVLVCVDRVCVLFEPGFTREAPFEFVFLDLQEKNKVWVVKFGVFQQQLVQFLRDFHG